ncbi:MAG: ATP-binding cassette domain-containing protein [Atopobiaceae bacterium]|nr:ATP-binding cassette domain-containing protein [Atopobiaceae bacterium]MBR3313021.1 ATP-binding cassette domain-containing protein [Atopobiaceae bacterium]
MMLPDSQTLTRAKLDARANERAYAELAASVSDARRAPRIDVNELEQAFGAAKTCLRYCGVEPGSVPEGITDLEQAMDFLCRPSGAMRRKVRLEGDWYRRAFGAMVARLDTGEAVALLPRGLHGYKYLDVGTGRMRRVGKSVASHIEPEAVFFYRPLPQGKLTVRDLVRFVFSVFDRGDYVVVVAAALAATLVGLFPAWANNVAFKLVVPSGYAGLIAPVAALLVGVALSTILIGACRNLVTTRVALKLDVSTEAATFARVMALPPSFFKEYAAGNLGMRVSQVSFLVQQISSLLLGSALTCLLSLVYLVQIGLYTPVLAVPAFVVVALQSVFIWLTMIITARYERDTKDAEARLSGKVTALLSGIQKVKLAGAEERAFAQWAHGYAEYARSAYNRPVMVRALAPISSIISMLGTIAIYYFAGSARIAVADFMSFNVAFGQITAAILEFTNVASQFAQIGPMLELVRPILAAEPEVANDKPTVTSVDGSVTVSDVSFRYNEDAPYVLKDISFRIKAGEYVALVGKSGCGKSTIVRLLLGFEKPEHGAIYYGRNDVSRVELRSLRSHIGVVMQDGSLFMGDLASNITISAPTATLDDAWEAAELAGIADDIRQMPMGMQTIVMQSGSGISGGQRQRIMIARAICGKKRVLIFDEATSALDNITQKHVSQSLESLKCTRIVVAHRLSTVRHCDRILVIDGGCVAEEGTYEELVAKGGVFANLVARQRLETEM